MRILETLLLTGAIAALPACGGLTADRCEALCDCEACSDRGHDECAILTDLEADVASVYGCDEEYVEFTECEIDRYSCDNGHFRLENNECDAQRERLHRCEDDGSSVQF